MEPSHHLGDDIHKDIDAVERGLAVVRQVTRREQDASKPDKYGRVPADMPTALRVLYETGSWHSSPVYCWDLVHKISAEGHEKAKSAEDSLAHMSFRPPPGLAQVAHTTLRAEHSPAVTAAASTSRAVRDALSACLREKREKRAAHVRNLNAEYRRLREKWIERLELAEKAMPQKEKDERLASDRLLVMATRASSGMGGGMSVKECDACLNEIKLAGGTAGGVSRWNSSLATIPEQDLSYHPPDGGILMDDPLAEHYAAKNINPWTRAERYLFLEKFISHNKNFRRIATFFEHKSVEDVVRFYFENKKALKLKQLTKEAQMKKRTTKKNTLIELSRLPTESRSIKNNFAGEAASAVMEGAYLPDYEYASNASSTYGPSKRSETALMREAGKGWKPRDQQMLIFALCRHRIEDDFTSQEIPIVWCHISYEVCTKTPAQCRQFYAHFKSLLGLENYQPPAPAPSPKLTPKRPRPSDAQGPGSDGDEQPRAVRQRRNSPNDFVGTASVNGVLNQPTQGTMPRSPAAIAPKAPVAPPGDLTQRMPKDDKIPNSSQPERMEGIEIPNAPAPRPANPGSESPGVHAPGSSARQVSIVAPASDAVPQARHEAPNCAVGLGPTTPAANETRDSTRQKDGPVVRASLGDGPESVGDGTATLGLQSESQISPEPEAGTIQCCLLYERQLPDRKLPPSTQLRPKEDRAEHSEPEVPKATGSSSKSVTGGSPSYLKESPVKVGESTPGVLASDLKTPVLNGSTDVDTESGANEDSTPVSVKVEPTDESTKAEARRPVGENYVSANGHPPSKPAIVGQAAGDGADKVGNAACNLPPPVVGSIIAPASLESDKVATGGIAHVTAEKGVAGGAASSANASGVGDVSGGGSTGNDVVVVNAVAASSAAPASVK